MAELTTTDKALAGTVLLLVVSMGINVADLVDQTPPWYYCEIENTLQQCSSLTSYGIPDAKCIIANPEVVGASSDICTKGGTRQAWKPITDYVEIKPTEGQIVVEAIQDCWNTTYQEEEISYETTTHYSKEINKTTGELDVWTTTTAVKEMVDKVRTQCKPKGYSVTLTDGTKYKVEGECCGYFESSPYKQYEGLPVISCRQTEKGICNPLIQQTSGDYSEYDELGRIYVLSSEKIDSSTVGEYDYVKKKPIVISTIKSQVAEVKSVIEE